MSILLFHVLKAEKNIIQDFEERYIKQPMFLFKITASLSLCFHVEDIQITAILLFELVLNGVCNYYYSFLKCNLFPEQSHFIVDNTFASNVGLFLATWIRTISNPSWRHIY